MAGGPNANLSGNQPQAMGESWSDLMAIEYLHESGFTPVGGENPFAVGPYVTGDKVAGIRNYGMNNSPLNYSDVGYDFVCNDTHVHAADAGPRRRRDLERDELRHPAGVHRPLRRSTGRRAAGSSWCSTRWLLMATGTR